MTQRQVTATGYRHDIDPGSAARSQLLQFRGYCERAYGRDFTDHLSFFDFSVARFRDFWSAFLGWSGILHSGSADVVCDGDDVEHARFFPHVRLNYVENLLSGGEDDSTIVVARHAGGRRVELTRGELRDAVTTLAVRFRRDGLSPGDRVVAVAANTDRLLVAGLAALAVGATLSTAPTDMGVAGVLSRFVQLDATMLLYESDGDATGERIEAIVAGLPTLRTVVALDAGTPVGAASFEGRGRALDSYTAPDPPEEFEWPRLPFDHPLFILFSSGTTGPPKCIVHSAGGTLLEHVKEHRLHGDLGSADTLYFHTSPAWMMWNWQLSALAVGARIVLNAAPVAEPSSLWSLVDAEQVTVFGTSPAYLRLCEVEAFSPRTTYELERLRLVMSTGAVLADTQFDWVAQHVKDLPIHSISGGTDIVGCFVLGAPDLPVRRGRTPCRSLGLDVVALDPDPVTGIGELVCRRPFPSRPTGLFGDADGSRFHRAYFAANAGVWTHGDLIEIGEDGSARMHGRSDSVLNVSGVRIGPAEIYAIVDGVPGVVESLVVEQQVDDGAESSRLVLLVVMAEAGTLDQDLRTHIRTALRVGASAQHVPRVIAEVAELPRTFSGKPSESAVRDVLNGVEVRNVAALRNPQSIETIAAAVHAAEHPSAMPAPSSSLVEELRSVFADSLGLDDVRPDESFFALGGTSLMLVGVRRAIQDRLGHDLPMSAIFQAPRAKELAARIESDSDEVDGTLVELRPGTGRPIFAIHDASGDVLAYRGLAVALTGDRPVYGVRAKGLDRHTTADESVAAMVRSALTTVRAKRPRGPYTLLGYSFGSILAFEAARALESVGETVDQLVLIDPYLDPRSRGRLYAIWFRIGYRTLAWAAGLFGARRGDALLSVRIKARRLGSFARRSVGKSERAPTPSRSDELEARVVTLMRGYRPAEYGGDATILIADRRFAFRPDFVPRWQRAIRGRTRVVTVAGDHAGVIGDPEASGVLREVDRILGARSV